MIEIESVLSSYSCFKGLAPKHLEFLSQCARQAECAARELLCREGETADKFYLILEGRFSIEVFTPERGAVPIQTVDAGEVIGWSWLADPPHWHFDLRAVQPAKMIAFDAARVRRECEADPKLGYALVTRFLEIVVERLQATRMQLLDLYHARP